MQRKKREKRDRQQIIRQRPVIKSYLCLFTAGLLISISCGPDQPPANPDSQSSRGTRDISKLLEKERTVHGLPAVAAVVIHQDKIVAQGAAGIRKLGRPEQVQIDDRWHLGSCTKSITASMTAVLVERGLLSWDTTIAEALPDLVNIMRPEYREVTIEMLLANRGGIGHEWDVP